MEKKDLSKDLRVFRGENASKRYFQSFKPPLIEVPENLNPYAGDGVEILASLCSQTPFGNSKQVVVYSMLEEAEKTGRLEGIHTLVEGSSGNTAYVLGVMARSFGVKRVIAVVPQDLTGGKLDVLRLLGMNIVFNDPGESPKSAAGKAREMGKRAGYLNLCQYENPANPAGIEKYYAPWIDQQTNGEVTVIAAGLGTTGTALAFHAYFKRKVAIVGVNLLPGEEIPGLRTLSRIEEDVRFPWSQALTARIEVLRKASLEMSLRLVQAGYQAGPSSGSAMVGLLEFLQEHKEKGTLDKFRNNQGKVIAVVICPDGSGPYQEKYLSEMRPDIGPGGIFPS